MARQVKLTPEQVLLISEAISEGDGATLAFVKLIQQFDDANLIRLRQIRNSDNVKYLQGALDFTGGLLEFFKQAKQIELEENE